MHAIAAKAVALRIAATEEFRARQRQTIANARAFADELIAGGLDVLTGGTDVHLVLVDVTAAGYDGSTAEERLEEIGITVNRNAIPFDERPPMNPSGLRIGTPALTTRGLDADDMREIARVICAALSDYVRERARLAAGTDPGARRRAPALPAALGSDRLRIWVDCTAAAHPVVLRPVIALLRERGHEVSITARDYGQTEGLLDRFGLEYESFGSPRRRRHRRRRRWRSAAAAPPSPAGRGRGASTSRSPTARSTSPPSARRCGSRRRRCRTTSSPGCSASSPGARPGG